MNDLTIINGDALNVLRTLEAETVEAVITDPPYGIGYQSARRTDTAQRKPKIANDGKPFIWFLYDAYRILKADKPIALFCEWRHQETFRIAMETAGFIIKSQVIWDRDWHGLGDLNGQFAPQHDVVWFASKGRFEFPGERPKSILRFKRVDAEALQHPNEKPIALMRYLVETLTSRGDTVLDPFCGSGTTAVACSATGRKFVGCEIDANYIRIAERRLQETQMRLI
jgi:DNA modification methylase